MGSFSGITFSSASTEVGDARNLAERGEHTSGQRHLGVLGPTWALGPSLALLVSWACGSWSSHAHPLASCFFSLALLVSLNSFVYLRERHISWGFSALGAFEGSCSESWSLGLAVLEPHAHAFVWYFFSLVWLVSLVVISLVVISLVVLCLHTQGDVHQTISLWFIAGTSCG